MVLLRSGEPNRRGEIGGEDLGEDLWPRLRDTLRVGGDGSGVGFS